VKRPTPYATLRGVPGSWKAGAGVTTAVQLLSTIGGSPIVVFAITTARSVIIVRRSNLQPEDDSTYYNRDNAYFENGEYDRAAADYNQAIRLGPSRGSIDAETGLRLGRDRTFADYYCARGLSYESKGELDSAIADFSKALRLNFKHIGACEARAAHGTRSAIPDTSPSQGRASEGAEMQAPNVERVWQNIFLRERPAVAVSMEEPWKMCREQERSDK
jgi:tetratricopeptide (TPR) repeat protein